MGAGKAGKASFTQEHIDKRYAEIAAEKGVAFANTWAKNQGLDPTPGAVENATYRDLAATNPFAAAAYRASGAQVAPIGTTAESVERARAPDRSSSAWGAPPPERPKERPFTPYDTFQIATNQLGGMTTKDPNGLVDSPWGTTK